MLMDIGTLQQVLGGYSFQGVLHVGAHECEEMSFYLDVLQLHPSSIYWIEAIPSKVQEASQRGVPNVYQAVITDKDGEEVEFHVSNNGQSSSILPLKTHLTEHPDVWYVDHFKDKSITLDTFLEKHKTTSTSLLDFWNLDIQGSELLALRGAVRHLPHVKALYLEVNEKELYEGCAMVEELDAFLQPFGMKRVLTKMTNHGWGDALYVKKEEHLSL